MSTLISHALALGALLPLSLAACASHSLPPDGGTKTEPRVADGAKFTIEVGQSIALADDSRLRYVRVVNDSRCPPDVQCVWEGDAIVAFEWSDAGRTATFELHTGQEPRAQVLGARTLRLDALARGTMPAATMVVETNQ